MEPLYAILTAVLIALITGTVTWLVSRRTTSGRIDTSEAAKLWDEGTTMRQELRDEVISTKAQVRELTHTNELLTEQLSDVREQLSDTREQLSGAREQLSGAREQERAMRRQIENVHEEVRTGNALTLGELADNAETRRILETPRHDRTQAERRHLATADDRIPAEYHPRIPEEDKIEAAESDIDQEVGPDD